MQTTKEIEREARREKQLNDAFDRWRSDPMTRMGMSLIPAAEHQDTLKLLLRSAFDAGSSAGTGNAVGDFMGALLDGMLKDKPRA